MSSAEGPATPAGVQQAWSITIAKAENVDKAPAKKAAHRGAAKASPGRNRYRYRQQFGIVVICDNERAQERAYARLQRAGFKQLRVVTV